MEDKKTARQKRIEELETKMEQLKKQKQELIQAENKRKRAKRTNRLIQIGALSEQYFNSPDIEPKIYEKMIAQIVALPQVKAILNSMETNGEMEAVKAVPDKPETSDTSEQ